jgi:hypothetical protein
MTMRAIKFRGKRLDNGEWIFGHMSDPDTIRTALTTFVGEPFYSNFTVDPATAGQFTGVCNSKGTEVYEGDIIRHGEELFEIVFEDGCFWRTSDDDIMELHTILGMGSFEVVGNIHDNSELLKGE